MDGVHSRPKGINSLGDASYDLIVTSLTTITSLEKNIPTDCTDIQGLTDDAEVYKDLQKAVNNHGLVITEGFLKFAIQLVSMPGNTSICQGCLADFDLKNVIELRLKTIQECNIPVGTHVKVKGEMVRSSYSRPYMMVQDVADIIIVPDKIVKTRLQMVQAKHTPVMTVPSFKKIKIESEETL